MTPRQLGRLWRTLRHLRPIQFTGRLAFRLARPRPDLRPAPPRRAASQGWHSPAAREPSLVGPVTFRFMEVERALDDAGWDDPRLEKLWRYNQHYFDDLSASGAQGRADWHAALITRWVSGNPPGRGTGWEPYPTSLRIVNWIKWMLSGGAADAAALHSLAVQVRWLTRRLEWHLLGNHLFANAKALVHAGLFFDGPQADAWLAQGLDILDRELPEQVLDDGGQFERSPMYHALALEDVLDLIHIAQCLAAPESPAAQRLPSWRATAARMLYWLRCMCHPDGGIGLFNDAAHGIAPDNAEIERLAAVLGVQAAAPTTEGLTHLQASGYVRVARGRAVALIDAAPVGPDYLPGHAHADTLSFELSLGTQRIVVNGGTSCYGMSARRLAERGTATHSTVQLAGCDSSEVWSGFRVGRRARPGPLRAEGWQVECSHDGYRFLPGSPVHKRRWHFEPAGLLVDDAVEPAVDAAVARYHLAPGLQLRASGPGTWLVTQGESTLARVRVEVGEAAAVDGLHAPRFGVLIPARCLEVNLVGGRASTRWLWDDDAHPVPE